MKPDPKSDTEIHISFAFIIMQTNWLELPLNLNRIRLNWTESEISNHG